VDPLLADVLAFADRLMEGPVPSETAVDESKPASVTIGIATYDDFDGAWFTINSLYLHHPEVMRSAEVVLIDNRGNGPESPELKRLDTQLPNVRYVPAGAYSSTAIRDRLFSHSRGDVVIVLDSHVLLPAGALQAVIEWFDAHPGSRDLIQGPMLAADNQKNSASHMEPVWSAGMYGVWGYDERADDLDGEAFEIPQHGLAAFACRRDAWPGLSTKFVGFGGEEGYVHEKIRLAGGRVLCLPAFRWQHRFPRPRGVSYRLNWADRVRNYAIGWSEVGLDPDVMAEHFVEATGLESAPEIVARVRRGIQTAFWEADGVICVNDDLRPGRWAATLAAFANFGIVPIRLSQSGGDVTDDLVTARHALPGLGWRTAIVVGDLVASDEDDVLAADAVLRAGGSTDDRSHLVARVEVDAG